MITDFAALALASIAVIVAAGTAGVTATLLSQIRDSQRALEAERQRFAAITEAASKANTSLAEQLVVVSDKVNSLDFFIKTGNAKK